MELPSGIEW